MNTYLQILLLLSLGPILLISFGLSIVSLILYPFKDKILNYYEKLKSMNLL